MVVSWQSPASAHRGEESYLYLNVAAEDLDGEVHLPYADIREVFGLTLDQDDPEAIRSEIDANLA
ncbi:MAG: hypothetical protein AAF467_27185, partial [Actinomycetota bacterium]